MLAVAIIILRRRRRRRQKTKERGRKKVLDKTDKPGQGPEWCIYFNIPSREKPRS